MYLSLLSIHCIMTKLISLKATVNSIDSFPCLGVVLVGQVRVVPLVGKVGAFDMRLMRKYLL